MEITVLGSGGCTVIPRPLCFCSVCEEARDKGVPYVRTGPALFLNDEKLLVDTPAEISSQLNKSRIQSVSYLGFTHFDPDHVEGFRVVEQISLDFRSWTAYPNKQIQLILPEFLKKDIKKIKSIYGPVVDFYQKAGFIKVIPFQESIRLGRTHIQVIPLHQEKHPSSVWVFMKEGKKVVYAPCDIKPFPEKREEVQGADLLVIQPGIFEEGLKHGFTYPEDHISRKTLYTFPQTLALSKRIQAKQVLFVHLEEYWNRSYDDYRRLENQWDHVRFAYDGLKVTV
ncbi:hypothetical protein KGY73_07210 [bacterium]|nr:hypothetical protein [bacterium]